ncbi:MAG: OmpH family outer membrane protein [Ottowia sp.]|nr:OmpH family outer membrane protein [Ottowia sp.]
MSVLSRSLMVAAFAVAVALSPAVQAQDGVRIGFVNTDRLLSEAAPAKAAQAKLEREFSQREKELDAAAKALQAASDQFERNAVTMSDGDRAAAQRRLVEQDRDFQRKRRAFQEDLDARKQQELQQLLDRANQVVVQVAERERYDAIFQDAVYINPRLDITDKVLSALNGGK